ncbi:MAG: acyltransferase family protein [Angustibacter sp.]
MSTASTTGFREDVQGLRVVAVLLVVLYHVGGVGISGGYVGVDVFFVISGFLITQALVREAQEHGRVSLSRFYARRIRRLLPMATVVLVTTVLVARLWGSVFQAPDIARDAWLAVVYAINYGLAAEGVNYQMAAGPPSPLQHYWSLAVEEQFYLVWPLVVGAVAMVLRRRRAALRAVLVVLVVAVCAVSLAASITTTASNAPLAYFSLHTRAWELGVGALVAIGAPVLRRIPGPAGWVMAWVGLAAICWSAFSYTDETPFPGTAALVPVLGTALVVVGGFPATGGARPGGRRPAVGSALGGGAASVTRLVRGRLVQGLGRVSYGWYLWHWPVLVLAPALFGRRMQWWEDLQLAAIALWLAVLSYWILEAPALRLRLRRLRWFVAGLGLSLTAAATAAVVIVTLPSLVGGGRAVAAITLDGADTQRIAQAVAGGTSLSAVPSNLMPSLEQVQHDQPASSKNGCHADFLLVGQGVCRFGSARGAKTMVLFGDSHAQQWLPGLDAAARQERWRLVSWTKAACSVANYLPFSPELNRPYTECAQWRDLTIRRIIRLRPDHVIVAQSDLVPGTRLDDGQWAELTVATVQRFRQAGLRVTYLLDTPVPNGDAPECVAEHLADVGACTVPRDQAYPYPVRHEMIARSLAAAGIPTLEPVDWFCTATDCPAVVSRYLVYRDESHISTSYSAWLAPLLRSLFR